MFSKKNSILIKEENEHIKKFFEKEEDKKNPLLKEILIFGIVSFCIVLPFRIFLASPYLVSGTSMIPTFDTGHYLIVDKISYKFENPKRYDVIVMKYPKDTSKDFIKRVIGLPGEKVEIKNGKVTIINAEHPEGFTLNEKYVVYTKDENMSFVLEDDNYFIMGDNRSGSFDSRYWGSLPKEDIIGKPIIRLLPLKKIGFYPGQFEDGQL